MASNKVYDKFHVVKIPYDNPIAARIPDAMVYPRVVSGLPDAYAHTKETL